MQLGYPESAIVGIEMVLLACTIHYVIPLGAILLTGYLGAAVATHALGAQTAAEGWQSG